MAVSGDATAWCPCLGPRFSGSEKARVGMRLLIDFLLGSNSLYLQYHSLLRLLSSAVVIVSISKQSQLSRAYTREEAEFIEKRWA